ncbi:hypothetical protein AB0L75_20160 [Streptomyces sp. NPDC052101]|uniref:hypothetical protein n=1 Tax=Streptomyces sp. NPDC052101 TaxID=3155763 RepID=UPI003446847D
MDPTLLYWLASFGGLLLVYGVATWLPTLMRGEGYHLGSALTFVVLFDLGGIAGILLAGQASDLPHARLRSCRGTPIGPARVSAIWFALTAAGVFLLGVHMPLGPTFLVVFVTGVFLNGAQTMIYANVSLRSTPAHRATAVGWTSGMGRFGAVFGPWLGGRLFGAGNGDWASPPWRSPECPPRCSSASPPLRSARRPERRSGTEQRLAAPTSRTPG